MVHYYQPPISLPASYASQYSTLHQGRLYLLQALAEEEERGGRLTKTLDTLRAKLEYHDPAESQVSARKLKTAIKSVRYKVGRCQYRARALSANLANIVDQMEGAKQYQWQIAHQHYPHQTQYGQMMVMYPAAPDFALQSPLHAALTTQTQYIALTSPPKYLPPGTHNLYPYGASSQRPQIPVLHPAELGYQFHVAAYAGLWPMDQSQVETAFHSPVSSISSTKPIQFPAIPQDFEYDAISPLWNFRQRPWSWPSVASADPDAEGISEAAYRLTNSGSARHLSVINATSSEIRVDELSRETSGE